MVKVQRRPKRLLSHLSPTSGEAERRGGGGGGGGGAVRATIAECIVTVVVSHPLRPRHIA